MLYKMIYYYNYYFKGAVVMFCNNSKSILCHQMQKVVHEELSSLHDELHIVFNSAGVQWADAVDHIWSFGPKRNGLNLLINRVEGYNRLSVWSVLGERKSDCSAVCSGEVRVCSGEVRVNDSSVIAGFQMATQAGPLCEEPMHGVGFIVEQWGDTPPKPGCAPLNHCASKTQSESVGDTDGTCEQLPGDAGRGSVSNHSSKCGSSAHNAEDSGCRKKGKDVFGPMSGQLMSVVKEGCRKAFQTMPQRLMVAMYHCTIQADTDILGGSVLISSEVPMSAVAMLIYVRLPKLQIYSQVKIATVNLGSASMGCLSQCVLVSATQLHIILGASLMFMQLSQL